MVIHPGNLLFILYVVEDLLIDKSRQDFNEDIDKKEDEKDFDDDGTNEDHSLYSSYSKGSKNEERIVKNTRKYQESYGDSKSIIVSKNIFEITAENSPKI